MAKSTTPYWNPLTSANQGRWTPVTGLEGMAEELTLSVDPATGEYTRLTRFQPKADTTRFGGKSHNYPEEVFIVSGRLYDLAVDLWLEAGHYASRPAGELHGPFKTDVGCVVLELSFPMSLSNDERTNRNAIIGRARKRMNISSTAASDPVTMAASDRTMIPTSRATITRTQVDIAIVVWRVRRSSA